MTRRKTRVIWQGDVIRLDSRLFQQIYQKWWSNVYAMAYSNLKDEELCRDLVQDVFLEFWNRGADLSPIKSIEAYLIKSVKTALLKSAKQQYVVKMRLNLDEVSNNLQDQGFESRLSSEELQVVIKNVVQYFPEPRRTIFLLSVEEELTNVEIANSLTLSEKTITFWVKPKDT